MAQGSIPVDLFNPGQVFACMGFLEAAHVLVGGAEGRFDWTDPTGPRFILRASETHNPVEAVLEFLVQAECQRLAPQGYADPPATTTQNKKKRRKKSVDDALTADDSTTSDDPPHVVETFPAPEGDRLALPLRLTKDGRALHVTHWCDASSRNSFKLFAGKQRSAAIVSQMVAGIRELWKSRRSELLSDPLSLAVPLGGSSFKMDARKAWTPIDAGYSPDEQKHRVEASPVVELLAAIGLEHARPDEFETREVRYGVWQDFLPPVLARPALGGSRVGVPIRIFRFTLDLSGKNKNVTFAQEETSL